MPIKIGYHSIGSGIGRAIVIHPLHTPHIYSHAVPIVCVWAVQVAAAAASRVTRAVDVGATASSIVSTNKERIEANPSTPNQPILLTLFSLLFLLFIYF